jgi:hypothetical protein
MARACLVSGRDAGLDAVGADRLRDAGLPAFRTVERFAAFGFDWGLVMGSSEVCATPSVAPPQPRPAKSRPAGQDPEAGCSRLSHHSNALFGLECQSILSNKIAHDLSRPPLAMPMQTGTVGRFTFGRPFMRPANCVLPEREVRFARLEMEVGGRHPVHSANILFSSRPLIKTSLMTNAARPYRGLPIYLAPPQSVSPGNEKQLFDSSHRSIRSEKMAPPIRHRNLGQL